MTLGRRGFHSTRAQFASPYHYPEGPRSNIPFNPLTRFFWLRYWGFMGSSGKRLSRGIRGILTGMQPLGSGCLSALRVSLQTIVYRLRHGTWLIEGYSLADVQEQIDGRRRGSGAAQWQGARECTYTRSDRRKATTRVPTEVVIRCESLSMARVHQAPTWHQRHSPHVTACIKEEFDWPA